LHYAGKWEYEERVRLPRREGEVAKMLCQNVGFPLTVRKEKVGYPGRKKEKWRRRLVSSGIARGDA